MQRIIFREEQFDPKIDDHYQKIQQQEEIQNEIRYRFYVQLKQQVYSFYNQKICTPPVYNFLNEIIDELLQNTHTRIQLSQLLVERNVSLSQVVAISNIRLVGPMLTRFYLINKFQLMYESFSISLQSIQEIQKQFFSIPFNQEVIQEVSEEITQNQIKIQQKIIKVNQTFPNLVQKLHTKAVALIIFNNELQKQKEYYNRGLIDAQTRHTLETQSLQDIVKF